MLTIFYPAILKFCSCCFMTLHDFIMNKVITSSACSQVHFEEKTQQSMVPWSHSPTQGQGGDFKLTLSTLIINILS